MRIALLAGAALALLPTGAAAQPASAPDTVTDTDTVTAAAIDAAPRPEAASGTVAPRPEPGPGLAPIVLALPRYALIAALSPVRLALWTDDRYRVGARVRDVLWNDARTIGVTPVGSWNGGGSVTAGAHLAFLDIAGATLHVRATVGTRERQFYAASASSGDLLGPVQLQVGAYFRDVTAATFYGLGDLGGEADPRGNGIPPPEPLDPRAISLGGSYAQKEWTLHAGARWTVPAGVTLSLGGSLRRLDFGPARGGGITQLADVYRTELLPGFDRGVEAVRGEVGVQIDRRRVRYDFLSRGAPSSGWAAQTFAGYQLGLSDDPTRYPYVGGDVIGVLDLYRGDRVLMVRLSGDSVLADSEDVPFADLPSLGGRARLRGYSSGRFRDRVAALASAEYGYPISDQLGGYLFVDAGRVAPSAGHLDDEMPRFGFGLGLQFLSLEAMVMRGFIATSTDGGFSLAIAFEAPDASRHHEGIR